MAATYYPEGSLEGLAEARRRIAEAGRTGAEELDIGGLGLKEVPEELFELTQLKVLYLGLPKAAADKPWSERTEEDKKTCNAVRALPPALFASLLHLAKLHLEQNRLTSLPENIAQATHLKVLDLSGDWKEVRNQIGDDGARGLASLVNLTNLNLSSNQIGDDGARGLASLVNLTSLNLSWNQIGADGARGLASLVNLTSLDLSYNQIGADGARGLASLVNLTSLNLSSNQIGDDGARGLASLVNLTSLNLSWNQIGADGARGLASLVNLTSLDLTFNQIGADGARGLASLVNLTSLNLGNNQIGADGARGLASLVNLTSLDLSDNQIGADGARGLASLVNLTSLNLGNNQIGADGARGLASLVNLTSLDLWNNQIGDDGARGLASLVNLTSLNLTSNRIGADGARGLASLVNLTSLNLTFNQIGADGARGLSPLVHLTSLNLSDNQIGADGARGLASLVNLTSLNLSDNQIGADGARGLASLVNLTSLNLSDNQIGADGARGLASLVNLTSLDLSRTGIRNLSPLLDLTKLAELNCSGCEFDEAYLDLWMSPSLTTVNLDETILPGVPAEVLGDDCLENLRAHIADLSAGSSEVTDVKLMFLGNGRVGKTQIARRLRGEPYDDQEPSTHGVRVSPASLSGSHDDIAIFKIWDFGGQDIYHGTHALFLKTRAVFLLAWTPASEVLPYHEHNGFTFRNEPLGYWLAYVRHFSGPEAPVLIVQTQCDRPEQEVLRPPLPDDALDAFPFKKVLHYSAKEDRGRAALDEALADAVHWLRERQGVALIGKGRAAVKDKLEKLYARGKRLITQAEFLKLCEKAGDISSPPLLLDYLHNIGTVFYREGLFGDAIILDQAWALDAVYAVLDRDSKAFANIKRAGGRFRRSELAEWVWQKHGEAEQALFISFMQQCDICFTHREGDARIEAEYIAPDLLPARDDPMITAQLREKWGDGSCDAEATLNYELLPPGLMRSLIAKVGAKAGLAAEYWRDGFYFYDEKTHSRALVEQRLTSDWAGEIHVQTRHGQAKELLERLLEFIDERHDALGARTCDRRIAMHEPERRADAPAIKPVHEPTPEQEWYVSYAWNDAANSAREAEVDKLCAEAEARGIKIIRDKVDMRNGDRISKFMDRIGRGDRVFIFLSDKYLRSAYCMHELFDVWRHCRQEASDFIARTRVFVLPDAKIGNVVERAQYAKHWRKTLAEIDALVKDEDGLDDISEKDLADYRWMKRFASETANILTLVQDTLTPRNIDDFIKYGFDDEGGKR